MEKFPKHDGGLYISHNDHRSSYQTVQEYLEDATDSEFVSEEEKQWCIDNNDLWSIQWYPDTPIGSYTVYGSSFESIVNYALYKTGAQPGRKATSTAHKKDHLPIPSEQNPPMYCGDEWHARDSGAWAWLMMRLTGKL